MFFKAYLDLFGECICVVVLGGRVLRLLLLPPSPPLHLRLGGADVGQGKHHHHHGRISQTLLYEGTPKN